MENERGLIWSLRGQEHMDAFQWGFQEIAWRIPVIASRTPVCREPTATRDRLHASEVGQTNPPARKPMPQQRNPRYPLDYKGKSCYSCFQQGMRTRQSLFFV